MNVLKPLPSVEVALEAWLRATFGLDDEEVGGDLLGSPPDGYIRIRKLPGRATRLEGDFVLDIEVFGRSYLAAESRALDIEAALLGYPHVVEVGSEKVVFDEVTQNTGPHEVPWDNPGVSRILSTYVITIRR